MVSMSRIQRVAAWIALAAFLNLLIANSIISLEYPGYALAARPPAVLLYWRNGSLVFVALSGLTSLPRWQSIASLAATLILLYYSIPF